MLKALISITAALAIFAAGSAIVTEASLAKGRAPGVYGKNAVQNSSPRAKTAKSAGNDSSCSTFSTALSIALRGLPVWS